MVKLKSIKTALDILPDSQSECPVGDATVLIESIENLINWSLEDEKELIKVGLPYGFISEVSKRCKYYELANNLCAEQKKCRQIKRMWDDKVTFAERLKSRILVTLGHCNGIVAATYDKLSKYLEKTGALSVPGQLESLYEIALDNKEKLMALGFTRAEFDTIKKTVEELQSMKDYLDITENRKKDLTLLRDKAYAYLKQGAEQIINHGIYALWKNPARLEGYQLAKINIQQLQRTGEYTKA